MTMTTATDTAHVVVEADAIDGMRALADGRFTTVLTDPPYGLGFMGKGWDHGVPGEPYWREALRVAKPGAFLLAFGGTRTFHRLAVAIEDAGWELRDCICWLYGSGFPKSMDIGKALDKAAGAERNRGCGGLFWRRDGESFVPVTETEWGALDEKDRARGNVHPTVKPLELMRYLARLTASPTGGELLDPFCGSGSTLVAAKAEGRPALGIDNDPLSVAITRARLSD